MAEKTRPLRTLAREMLEAAKEEGLVKSFKVREGGKATILPEGSDEKLHTEGLTDTMGLIHELRHGGKS